ncbi:hypothetical protein PG989_015988 [Apiospora arundinis]
MDTFSFAQSVSLDYPLSIRIVNLEGDETPVKASTLFTRPDLRYIGSNTSWNEWLDVPIPYKSLPLNSCLAITLWDVSPTGGKQAQGHAIPFGGTTLPLFDKDNQVQKGRLKCMIHRHQKADGNDDTTTPYTVPKRRQGTKKNELIAVDKERDEMDRMDKLFKKYEMNEIPKVEWLDHLVWRVSEKRASEATRSSVKSLQRQASLRQEAGKSPEQNGSADTQHDAGTGLSQFTLTIELPRFDFPVVFTDHEYPPAPISTVQQLSASQSNIDIKPPPGGPVWPWYQRDCRWEFSDSENL